MCRRQGVESAGYTGGKQARKRMRSVIANSHQDVACRRHQKAVVRQQRSTLPLLTRVGRESCHVDASDGASLVIV